VIACSQWAAPALAMAAPKLPPVGGASRRRRGPLAAAAIAAAALHLAMSADGGSTPTAFMGRGKAKEPEPKGLQFFPSEGSGHRFGVKALTFLAACSALAAAWQEARKRKARELQRPYQLQDTLVGGVADPEGDLCKIVTWIQDTVVVPIDERLPGRPFEYDLHSFPFTPMVLVIGNHSSGKSTFINRLLGLGAQETGVAPTDDGFTVLERQKTDSTEDGPTVLGCPENRPFRELQRFGQAFSGHFRRKRKALADDAVMPFGLQVVDTPGMIDLPVAGSLNHRSVSTASLTESTVRGRGYNFVDVIRWWAKRADLILLLFDPDKPGTTGETLEVLTKSLAGLDHKFLVVLNKVDQLDNSVDFARAYGTLGWALSKVIRRKDIPQIYTMFNAGFDLPAGTEHKLPLDDFARRREEVVAEVLRARERHFDNVVTAMEETLRQVSMVATVLGVIRNKAVVRVMLVTAVAVLILAAPIATLVWLLANDWVESVTLPFCIGVGASYILLVIAVSTFFREYLRQYRRLLATSLDETFEETYADFFIHNDGEDHRSRWQVVRPKITSILSSIPCASHLPAFPKWEVDRIDQCLTKDVWHLRQLARLLRVEQLNEAADSGYPSRGASSKRRGGGLQSKNDAW